MAVPILSQLELERKKKAEAEAAKGGSSAPVTLNEAGQSSSPAGATKKPGAPTQSGRWTNVQQFLQANQGNADKFASNVAGKVQGAIDTAKTGLETEGQQFATDVDKATLRPDDQLNTDITTNPQGVLDDPTKKGKVDQILKGDTSVIPGTFIPSEKTENQFITAVGGMPYPKADQPGDRPEDKPEQSALGTGGLLGAATKGDATEKFALLGEMFGKKNPRYGRGNKKLDQLILSAAPEARGVMQRLADTNQNLSADVQASIAARQGLVEPAKATTTATSQAMKDLLAGEQDKIKTTTTAAQTAQQTAIDTEEQDIRDAVTALASGTAPEGLSTDLVLPDGRRISMPAIQAALQKAGASLEDINKILPTHREELGSLLNPSRKVGTRDVVDPATIAKLSALENLAGTGNSGFFADTGETLPTRGGFNLGLLQQWLDAIPKPGVVPPGWAPTTPEPPPFTPPPPGTVPPLPPQGPVPTNIGLLTASQIGASPFGDTLTTAGGEGFPKPGGTITDRVVTVNPVGETVSEEETTQSPDHDNSIKAQIIRTFGDLAQGTDPSGIAASYNKALETGDYRTFIEEFSQRTGKRGEALESAIQEALSRLAGSGLDTGTIQYLSDRLTTPAAEISTAQVAQDQAAQLAAQKAEIERQAREAAAQAEVAVRQAAEEFGVPYDILSRLSPTHIARLQAAPREQRAALAQWTPEQFAAEDFGVPYDILSRLSAGHIARLQAAPREMRAAMAQWTPEQFAAQDFGVPWEILSRLSQEHIARLAQAPKEIRAAMAQWTPEQFAAQDAAAALANPVQAIQQAAGNAWSGVKKALGI